MSKHRLIEEYQQGLVSEDRNELNLWKIKGWSPLKMHRGSNRLKKFGLITSNQKQLSIKIQINIFFTFNQ